MDVLTSKGVQRGTIIANKHIRGYMMNTHTKCIVCNGTGHDSCWKCGGSGKKGFNPWEVSLHELKDCDRCGGSGRDPDPDPACNGTGLAIANKQEIQRHI